MMSKVTGDDAGMMLSDKSSYGWKRPCNDVYIVYQDDELITYTSRMCSAIASYDCMNSGMLESGGFAESHTSCDLLNRCLFGSGGRCPWLAAVAAGAS